MSDFGSDFEDLLNDLSSSASENRFDTNYRCISSDDSSRGLSEAVPSGRKRKRIRKYVSLPRVVLNDVRRSYASMFINVRNSSDFPLIYGFMDTYFSPEFEHSTCKHDLFTNIPRTRVSKGLIPAAMFWYKGVHAGPDAVIRMSESQLLVIPNTTRVKIVIKVTFCATCTKVYDKKAKQEIQRITEAVDSNRAEQQQPQKKKRQRRADGLDGSLREMMDAIDALNDATPLVRQPFQITCEGTITLHVDENKLIHRVEVATVRHKAEFIDSATEWARACGLEDVCAIHGCGVDTAAVDDLNRS